MRLFRKKNKKKEVFWVKSIAVDPETMVDPHTAEEYARRGIAFYARQQYERAERDLRAATALEPELVDGHYGLGLVLKAAGDREGSQQAFEQVMALIHSNHMEADRARVLDLLAQGHLRQLAGKAGKMGEEQ